MSQISATPARPAFLALLALSIGVIAWVGNPGTPAAAGTAPAWSSGGAGPPAGSIAYASRQEDFQMFGGIHVKEGEVHPRDLVVIGGNARVEGEVRGDVVVIMGNLYLSGTAHRDVVTVLSSVQLDDGALIEGSFVNILGGLKKHQNIDIEGDFVDLGFIDLSNFGWGPIGGGILHIFQLLKAAKLALLFIIIIIIAALAPKRVAQAGNAFATDWPKALLYGLVAYIVGIVAIFILCITIIGIPVAIGLGIGMKIAKWMGQTSIFFLVGDRFGRNLFGRNFSLFPSILIGFVLFGALRFIPLFVGEMIWMVLAVLGLGLSLATRFGSGEPWFKGKKNHVPLPPPPAAAPPSSGPPPPPPSPEGSPG